MTPVVGQIWADQYGDARIMAVVEDYVVARRRGCVPFMRHLNEFCEKFVSTGRVSKTGQGNREPTPGPGIAVT